MGRAEDIADKLIEIACEIIIGLDPVMKQYETHDVILGLFNAAAILSLKTNKTLDDAQRDRLRDDGSITVIAMMAAKTSLEELKKRRAADLNRN